jgi:hypothetical protein
MLEAMEKWNDRLYEVVYQVKEVVLRKPLEEIWLSKKPTLFSIDSTNVGRMKEF